MTPAHSPRLRLGEVLMKLGHVNEQQLHQLILRGRQARRSLGHVVIEAGLCTEEQMFSALAFQAQLPIVDLDAMSQAPEVFGVLTNKFAREHRVVAIELKDRELMVAMTAPASLATQDAVRAVSGRSRLRVVLASDAAMKRALDRFHPEAGTRPVVTAAKPAPALPRPELVDSIGLSSRAGELVRQMTITHGISTREVLQRVLETWADNTLRRTTPRS